jgi:TolB protein
MRLRALSIVCAVFALAVPAAATAAAPPRMQLISHALNGGLPNGPSRNAVISQDRQFASLVAYDSDASNIVPGDTNGLTDVFLVRRKRPFGLKGPPWRRGKTVLASRGMGGTPANGRSYGPDIDGEQLHTPRCLAFVSEASNLVPGDTNGVADAFILFLRNGRIRRVSVGSGGQQANGATYEVRVDGHCDRIAFTSDATNLALTGTSKLSWRSAVTAAPPPGVKQVYVRALDDRTDNSGLHGLTFLASADAAGVPGNGNSSQIAFARSGGGCGRQGRCGSFSGEAVAFASHASNLAPGDTNGVSDVFLRSFPRRFVRLRFPRTTRVLGEKVRSTLVGVGPLLMKTTLLSGGAGGEPANGASDQPAVNDSGDIIAFRTTASNVLPGDSNGASDVVRADTLHGGRSLVSRTRDGQFGNDDSAKPAIGRTGQDILFESRASNLNGNDKNCTGDVYHLDIPHGNNQILTSLDSLNRVPNAPYGTQRPCPSVIAAPQINPTVSNYLNYAVWEASFPLLDIPFARRAFPGITLDDAAMRSNGEPSLHQIYMRYIGPR